MLWDLSHTFSTTIQQNVAMFFAIINWIWSSHLKADFLVGFPSSFFSIDRHCALLIWQPLLNSQRFLSINQGLFYNLTGWCYSLFSIIHCCNLFYNNFHSYNSAFIQTSHFLKFYSIFFHRLEEIYSKSLRGYLREFLEHWKLLLLWSCQSSLQSPLKLSRST